MGEFSLTFNSGEDCQCFNVTIIEDAIAEGNEVFRAVFPNLPNGATVGQTNVTCVTIRDNDGTKPFILTTGQLDIVSLTHSACS